MNAATLEAQAPAPRAWSPLVRDRDHLFGSLRRTLGLILGLTLGLLLLPAVTASAAEPVTWTTAKVLRWADGDTVVTTKGRVRLIGVDTPERGRCGAAAATRAARATAPKGTTVRLGNPRSVDNRDRHGRLLRYVVKAGNNVDLAARQIRRGAKARYDGRDGYDWHPRQAKYRRLDRNHRDYRCGSPALQPPGGSYQPVSLYRCPAHAPIKGNENSGIYHPQSSPWYDATTPEQCFATETAARAAGFRRAQY